MTTRSIPNAIAQRASAIWGAEHLSDLWLAESGCYRVSLIGEEEGPFHMLDAAGIVRCDHAMCRLLAAETEHFADRKAALADQALPEAV